MGTHSGSTSYAIPAFTLSPSTSTGTISYSDVAPVSGVNFNPLTQTYDWSTIATVGIYTLTMQGSLAGSTSVTTSFTLTITRTTLLLPSTAADKTYDLGTLLGSKFYTVPAFTTNPPG